MAFTCDICNASYPLRMSLSNHKRLKHGDTKKFNCQQCEYVTSKKGNYEQHIRYINEKLGRYVYTVERASLISPILINM